MAEEQSAEEQSAEELADEVMQEEQELQSGEQNHLVIGYDHRIVEGIEKILDEMPIKQYESVKKIKQALATGIPINIKTGKVGK